MQHYDFVTCLFTEGRYGVFGNAVPPLLVTLNTADLSTKTLPVNLTGMAQLSIGTAMQTATILYQDPTVLPATQDWATAAAQFTDIKFRYDDTISPLRNVSFCLSELQLLPSQVNLTAGKQQLYVMQAAIMLPFQFNHKLVQLFHCFIKAVWDDCCGGCYSCLLML